MKQLSLFLLILVYLTVPKPAASFTIHNNASCSLNVFVVCFSSITCAVQSTPCASYTVAANSSLFVPLCDCDSFRRGFIICCPPAPPPNTACTKICEANVQLCPNFPCTGTLKCCNTTLNIYWDVGGDDMYIDP